MEIKEYASGSNVLLKVGEKAVGHCTSHSVKMQSETKERAVKPPFESPVGTALYTDLVVTKQKISISSESLVFFGDAEAGYADLMNMWHQAVPVEVSCYVRGETDPYLKVNCILTNLDMSAPDKEDSTCSVSLENTGAPSVIDHTKFTRTSNG